jgi:hypothetical protein
VEYLTLDLTGHFTGSNITAWRLADGTYQPWTPQHDGRWHSTQLPIAIAFEGAMAAVYLADGRRVLAEGGVEEALARQALDITRKETELAEKDAEIERLRRRLEGRD